MTGGQGDADYVRKQCETSLKRLNVEYIDLYYQHRYVLQSIYLRFDWIEALVSTPRYPSRPRSLPWLNLSSRVSASCERIEHY